MYPFLVSGISQLESREAKPDDEEIKKSIRSLCELFETNQKILTEQFSPSGTDAISKAFSKSISDIVKTLKSTYAASSYSSITLSIFKSAITATLDENPDKKLKTLMQEDFQTKKSEFLPKTETPSTLTPAAVQIII